MAPFRPSDPEALYETYAHMLYRLAYAELASGHDAEDAVAEVFLRVLQAPPAFRDAQHEKAWLIRVLVNHCRDLRRKKSVRAYTPLEEVTALSAGEKEDTGVLSAVMKLQESNRIAVLLHYFEGYSVEETAKILRTTAAAVKMRLARSRSALKSMLKGADG